MGAVHGRTIALGNSRRRQGGKYNCHKMVGGGDRIEACSRTDEATIKLESAEDELIDAALGATVVVPVRALARELLLGTLGGQVNCVEQGFRRKRLAQIGHAAGIDGGATDKF